MDYLIMNRIILMIAAWMLAAGVAVAQEATVKRVELNPMDLSGKKYQRLDLNGDPCALVKVQVIADEVQFFGNVIPSGVEHRVGEYWVYMVAGSRDLRVQSPTFLPLEINFSDYGIKALEPSLTYIVTLSLPASVAATAAPSVTTTDEEVEYTIFSENDKYGYKDKNGRIIIPAKYDNAWWFSEGLAAVKINGKYGFIDKNDRLVIPANYDTTKWFSEGLAPVNINGKYGFIDRKGNMVIEPRFGNTYGFKKGFATVEIDGKYGLIDKTGKTVLPVKYEMIFFTEGMGRVGLEGKYGFIDRNGNFVVPLQYEQAGFFSEGLAGVKKGDKCGYINKVGTMVIPAKYSSVSDFCDGKAAVTYKGKIGFVDANGNFEACQIGTNDITVSGTVTDEKGEPLIGCNILIPSIDNKGTITDFEGNYRITVKQGTPLIFSYIGYRTQVVSATTGHIDVALVEGM